MPRKKTLEIAQQKSNSPRRSLRIKKEPEYDISSSSNLAVNKKKRKTVYVTMDSPEKESEDEFTFSSSKLENAYSKQNQKIKDRRLKEKRKGNQIECHFCPRMFENTSKLRRHLSKCNLNPDRVKPKPHKRNRPFDPDIDCLACGQELAYAHEEGDLQCIDCPGMRFTNKNCLDYHMISVHGAGDSAGVEPKNGYHECPLCSTQCSDKGTLARHMYTHTGMKPYSCPVCHQEFSRKYHLVRHNMQTGCDGNERPIFPCQVCGKEFNRKDSLREHLRVHAGQTKDKKIFTCNICQAEFNSIAMFNTHKKSHANEKPYECDICSKCFISSGALIKHRRMHTGERPFACDFCDKSFAAKETLNRHIKIHTGDKPHACEFCGKRFVQSSQLKSHLYFHAGQQSAKGEPIIEPFECDICGKTFLKRPRLIEHKRFIHFGEKPFECEICQKTFIRKVDLNRHMIFHSGVKSHVCPICSKAFAMKATLKVHLLTHTKEDPRSCDECGRAYIRLDCLLRHMRIKHRDMLEEIMCEAEKKKLQQQLLQVAAENQPTTNRELDEESLCDSIKELLTLLVDESTLRTLGWPEASIPKLLEAVILRCGHKPAADNTDRMTNLRNNVKLLFTVVLDDSAVKALLNNQTVDEVILNVINLANQ